VRHMVLAHTGEVFVKSSEGEGSIFTITLPEATTEEQR
jgi:signal transduction histidine kinase